ncbi:DUF6538 domain-containing protein [Sphingobium sp. WW5]|uniref:DUF6538 domain-containing protein n=1 Tax=unclassified Sphingobium TaxID=2611147 RepID=UPI003C1C0A4D
MTKRSKKPEATSATHASAHDEGESVTGIIADIVGEAGDDEVGMMGEDAGSRKLSRQSPATRSTPRQTPENQRKPAQKRVTSCVRDTKVGHNDPSKIDLTPSKQTKYSPPSWVTTVGHKRWPRGLSLRGSTFQFRVRVPADLRADFGCSHVKRSLRTDSPSLAMRLGRQAAAEIDIMFA